MTQNRAVASVINELVIDCADPDLVAEFWSGVLGWRVQRDSDGLVWMSASGVEDADDLVLLFQKVPEPKQVKNRVHIDVSPSGADQEEELQRLLGLGARHTDIGQEPGVSWIVLADPEGNEFCLLRTRRD